MNIKQTDSIERNIPSRSKSSIIFRMANMAEESCKMSSLKKDEMTIARKSIRTDARGPCICLLLGFMQDDEQLYYFHRHTLFLLLTVISVKEEERKKPCQTIWPIK